MSDTKLQPDSPITAGRYVFTPKKGHEDREIIDLLTKAGVQDHVLGEHFVRASHFIHATVEKDIVGVEATRFREIARVCEIPQSMPVWMK